MFVDSKKFKSEDVVVTDLTLNQVLEGYKITQPHWKCIDVIHYNDGREEIIEGHNMVMNGISSLIASMIGGKVADGGVKYWAVGSGLPAWDSQWDVTPPSPVGNEVKLNNEIARKAISPENIVYVNEIGNVVEGPTSRLKISVTFGQDEANGSWREFGLFAKDATGVVNSGLMIDLKYHKILSKTSEISSINRSIILEF